MMKHQNANEQNEDPNWYHVQKKTAFSIPWEL